MTRTPGSAGQQQGGSTPPRPTMRTIARLALAALREEARLWLRPPGSEPAPAPVAAPVASGWTYTTCIACCEPLTGHPMLCTGCLRVRGMAP